MGAGDHIILNPALNSLAISHRHNHRPSHPAELGQCLPRARVCKMVHLDETAPAAGLTGAFCGIHAQGDFLRDCSSLTAL